MTELQTQTEVEIDTDIGDSAIADNQNIDADVSNSESATETQVENKDNVQGRINKITAEKYAEKRRADELAQKLAAYEAQKPQVATTFDVKPPRVPDDLYDDDAMRKYHAEMLDYTNKLTDARANESVKKVLERQREESASNEATKSRSQLINQYAERGLKSGLTIEQMQLNEQVIGQIGISSELGDFIMSDDRGALIAHHLANNTDALVKLQSMSPLQAAVFIANEVKPAVLGPKKVTSAPDPLSTIQGGGSRVVDDFDRKCPGAKFS